MVACGGQLFLFSAQIYCGTFPFGCQIRNVHWMVLIGNFNIFRKLKSNNSELEQKITKKIPFHISCVFFNYVKISTDVVQQHSFLHFVISHKVVAAAPKQIDGWINDVSTYQSRYFKLCINQKSCIFTVNVNPSHFDFLTHSPIYVSVPMSAMLELNFQ